MPQSTRMSRIEARLKKNRTQSLTATVVMILSLISAITTFSAATYFNKEDSFALSFICGVSVLASVTSLIFKVLIGDSFKLLTHDQAAENIALCLNLPSERSFTLSRRRDIYVLLFHYHPYFSDASNIEIRGLVKTVELNLHCNSLGKVISTIKTYKDEILAFRKTWIDSLELK